jgi:hypothetical protein
VITNAVLEPEQEALLARLVEADRNIPRDQREPFTYFHDHSGDQIQHPGLPGGSVDIFDGDLHALQETGLLRVVRQGRGTWAFHVSPQGRAFYEEMKTRAHAPMQQVEQEIMSYLDAPEFQRSYPEAHRKWAEADGKLRGSDSQQQSTTIGHLCREAIQEFGTALVERHQPPDVDQDKAHAINRVRAVVDQHRPRLGTRVAGVLDSLIEYWRAVSNLVQRQEHGVQGGSLVLEDGRRVVFQTAIVMFEIDRALALRQGS